MKDRKLDMTILANYVRVKSPDKDKLAELVIRAKGPKRSMRQFAIDCGMNPSTMSRIVNKKTAGSNTDERILAIAEHADPDSGVNFEMLMEAHGKVTKQMSGKVRVGRQVTVERDVEDILLRELLQRGYLISSQQRLNYHDALNYRYRTDWAIYTNALSDHQEMMLWEFEIWPITGEPNDIRHSVMKLRQKLLMLLGLYYTGTMHPEKMSFVLTNQQMYDMVISSYEGVKFKDLFSLILVDLEKGRIKSEFCFPIEDGRKPREVFYPLENSDEADHIQGEGTLDWDEFFTEE